MLWSILKIVVFLTLAALLTYGGAFLLETPGQVTIVFGGREFSLSPIGFVIEVAVLVVTAIILLKLFGFLSALVHFVLGDETALTRFFTRNRERRGLDALSGSMLDLASGEAASALRKAAKAEKLLKRPEITNLLGAQAAELNGDKSKALELYQAMIKIERTRFVGIQGAMRLKLEAGETDLALALAKQAVALRPENAGVLQSLFDLQTKNEDWSGARETLNATMHARLLPRDVGNRKDAILSLADARKSLAQGDTERGHEAAKQANKLAPGLVPAAVLASEAQVVSGSSRKAAKLLTAAWEMNPHPDLAAAFARLEPNETKSDRRKRFETLISVAPRHAESRLLQAELALASEDFPAARKALGDLPETEPTTRTLAVMAAVERGQGAPEAVVRGWLAKALSASRGPQWVCGKCNHVHAGWAPVCDSCGAFDTLDWKARPDAEDSGLAQSTMLPLIVGGAEASGEGNATVRAQSDVEDAVISERLG